MPKIVFQRMTGTPLPANVTYTAAVTSTDTWTPNGGRERRVTEPAHLAAHDAGRGVTGEYEVILSQMLDGPQILYPGLIAMSVPYSGGTISLTHAPWAAGRGTVSITYRVMLGATQLATSLPYDTVQDAGAIIEVFADVTDDTGTTTVKVGEVTIAENPLGPQLSAFAIDYDTNAINLTSDLAATLTWRRYPPGHAFTNQAAEVLAGTGAIDGGSYAIESGANSDQVAFTGGITGPQEIWIVARVGSGPISNVVGGAVDITPAGTSLTAPNIVGTSIGGEPSNASSIVIPLPNVAIAAGDLITLPVGIDSRVSDIAGITITSSTGETVLTKQTLVDNNAGWDSQAIGLYYFRAASARTGGSVTINIIPGGVKSVDQIICTPIVRTTVKAAGDPFGQVLFTGSNLEIADAATAELTAVSAASRIESCIINDWTAPPGIAPSGWFVREVGVVGPMGIQTMSRNDQIETAGQVIAPVSVPLGANRRWSALTWELLPLGA